MLMGLSRSVVVCPRQNQGVDCVGGKRMQLLEETVRVLVERGQKTGCVTFGQVHEALAESDHDPDRLDQILTSLEEAGISVIDDQDD